MELALTAFSSSIRVHSQASTPRAKASAAISCDARLGPRLPIQCSPDDWSTTQKYLLVLKERYVLAPVPKHSKLSYVVWYNFPQ